MSRVPFKSTASDLPPAPLVREELDRILASELFTRAPRLSSFLEFIVLRTLAGEGKSLKEHVIAIELYGKAADFDTAADPIVRVDARRLRDRLREYYASTPPSGVVITIPKGSYTPAFHLPAVATAAETPTDPRSTAGSQAAASPSAVASTSSARHPARTWWMPAAVVLLVIASGALVNRLGRNSPTEPPRLITATSRPGAEENPSLSPDGNFVAFSWGGAAPTASHDIWIKAVDGDNVRQLTNTPDVLEKYPRWSPDGQFIAFTRYIKGAPSTVRVSALGGHEELIDNNAAEADWTPDGKSIVSVTRTAGGRSGLAHYVLETGSRRELTVAPEDFNESHPAVSPDGKRVAFQRSGGGRSAVLVLSLSGGEAAVLGDWNSNVIGGLTWTPDGRELLIARPAPSGRRLMRVADDEHKPEVPVPGIPYESIAPSVSRIRADGTYRLALVSGQQDVGLRLVDLQARQKRGLITADSPFCDATRMDSPGRFSPDGSKVAFASDRSGSHQIWVANRDGSALRAVTQLKDATVSLGAWSPDGRSLLFDATIGERTHIYVVPVNGGPAKRLTDGDASEIDPEWSRDGRWIYYSSTASEQATIWRSPSRGGTPVQLTSERGFEPRESPDGRRIYFIDRPRSYGLGPVANLKTVPAGGGTVERVDVPVMAGAWEVTDAGIVFVWVAGLGGPVDFARAPDVLQIYDFAERRVRTLGTLATRIGPFGATHFFTASRDGRWALISHVDRWDRDVLVVDHFR